MADALFSRVQQRVLALLFGQPDRRYQSAEIIRLARGGTGAAHRELRRLSESGWILLIRAGNQRHYQANRSAPAFAELHGLVIKTVAIVEPLRQALLPKAKHIRAAFVYGSLAKGTDQASSDVDLMLITERLGYPDIFEALQSAEAMIARPVNPNIMSYAEWRGKCGTKGSFAARVSTQPRLFILGSEDDLA
jgi:predicted nucleotidyltransferase